MSKVAERPTALVKQKCGHMVTVPLPRLKSLRQREIEYREGTLCAACWARTIGGTPEEWSGKGKQS